MAIRFRLPVCLESQWRRRFVLALRDLEPRLSEFESTVIAASEFDHWCDMDPEQAAEDFADELPLVPSGWVKPRSRPR